MKPKCPKCKKKVFKKPEVLDTKYTDTTPKKKVAVMTKDIIKEAIGVNLKNGHVTVDIVGKNGSSML